ncbi:MAG: RNA polymerase sigma factor [Terriglobia bacterium]
MATHLSDEPLLVAAAQQGDENAFRTLVNQYYWNIYAIVFKIARNHEDAEDALQDAFLKAFCNLERFQGNSRFYTWLVRIAVNEALMKLRKRRIDKQSVPLDDVAACLTNTTSNEPERWSDDPERRYAELEAEEIISKAMGGLSPRLCTVFLLRHIEELSMRETAETLGLSASAVKSRLVRARSRLRNQLQASFPGKHAVHARSQRLAYHAAE